MNITAGGTEGINFARIGSILMVLLGLYVISAAFMYLQGFIMTDVSTRAAYDLQNAIAAKINRLPLKYFDTTTHGEVLSRITNDVDILGHTLNQAVTQMISSITIMIGVFVMMLSISWIMTLIALV